MTTTLRQTVRLLTCFAALLLGSMACRAGQPVHEERWYVLQLDGEKAGHVRDSVVTNDKGQTVFTQEIAFGLARATQEVQITMKTEFVEAPDGSAVSMSQEQNLGLIRGRTVYTFTPEGIEELSEQAGVKRTTTHAAPDGAWLTPTGIEKLVTERLRAGDGSFSYRSLSPVSGASVTETKVTILEPKATAEAFGKIVPAVKWETVNSAMPNSKSVEWVDEKGRPVRSEVEVGGMKLTMIAADKEVALSKFRAPEAMAQTTIVPRGTFSGKARRLKDVMYTVSTADGSPLPRFPTAGGQRVTPSAVDPSSALVKVDVGWNVVETPEPDEAPYLTASRALNSEDPEIIALAREVTKNMQPNRTERAKAMRRFVHSYIDKKNLAVGFATASEVARTKQGDCSEHAVLLAAMLRVEGIPSRVVNGLIYTEQFEDQHNVFAYHMWTQALLDEHGKKVWVDLDATLPEYIFDSAHIALSNSALGDDDTLNSMATLTELIGNLKINVEFSE